MKKFWKCATISAGYTPQQERPARIKGFLKGAKIYLYKTGRKPIGTYDVSVACNLKGIKNTVDC